ncbi:hypothetical protein GCM10011332_33140 [Terasakiella brassicae]|uniref:Zorya protein ZorC EH domain-containing protein n=1 Tax=Terasakiella brassicae TaxID=1634917 RepID=A0A917FHG2_9PROT|nr:EH signature domain-containing protein [Terasakiella brassicae]GGF76505.1 hypothetical protein GCM10011332_33140 [Terasakiella brassicae]
MKLSERLEIEKNKVAPSFTPLVQGIGGVQKEVFLINEKWPDADHANIDDIDPEELCLEMTARLGRGDGFSGSHWDGVAWSKACQTVRALWETDLWDNTGFTELRDFFSKLVKVDPRPYLVQVFYNLYFETFQSGSVRTTLIKEILQVTYKRLRTDISELVEEFDLLEPTQAPSSISYLMTDFDNPYDGLQEMGIAAPHSEGLMEECHLEFLKRLEKPLADGDSSSILRLFKWLKPKQSIPPFELGATSAIEALLLPWKDRDPSQDTKKLIVDNLIAMFGDPRLNRSGPWMVMSDAVEQVIMRWLTEANLIAFLDIVGRVIKKEEPQNYHMWPDRRKFWESMWKKKRIQAAWVALSDAGRAEAKRIAMETGSKGLLGFANVNGDLHKCFLFLKCGNKIIAEGSHNFKVHVFDEKQDTCPKLFQSSYTINRIRHGNAQFGSFTHDAYRHWEQKVLQALM